MRRLRKFRDDEAWARTIGDNRALAAALREQARVYAHRSMLLARCAAALSIAGIALSIVALVT
jgi:hypothetical protein